MNSYSISLKGLSALLPLAALISLSQSACRSSARSGIKEEITANDLESTIRNTPQIKSLRLMPGDDLRMISLTFGSLDPDYNQKVADFNTSVARIYHESSWFFGKTEAVVDSLAHRQAVMAAIDDADFVKATEAMFRQYVPAQPMPLISAVMNDATSNQYVTISRSDSEESLASVNETIQKVERGEEGILFSVVQRDLSAYVYSVYRDMNSHDQNVVTLEPGTRRSDFPTLVELADRDNYGINSRIVLDKSNVGILKEYVEAINAIRFEAVTKSAKWQFNIDKIARIMTIKWSLFLLRQGARFTDASYRFFDAAALLKVSTYRLKLKTLVSSTVNVTDIKRDRVSGNMHYQQFILTLGRNGKIAQVSGWLPDRQGSASAPSVNWAFSTQAPRTWSQFFNWMFDSNAPVAPRKTAVEYSVYKDFIDTLAAADDPRAKPIVDYLTVKMNLPIGAPLPDVVDPKNSKNASVSQMDIDGTAYESLSEVPEVDPAEDRDSEARELYRTLSEASQADAAGSVDEIERSERSQASPAKAGARGR